MSEIQVPNILGQYLSGRMARREVEKQDFLSQNGQALMAGDPNVMGQYARFDPEGAMGLMQQQQQAKAQQEAMAMRRSEFEMTRQKFAAETAARIKAEKLEADAAAAERIKQAVASGLQAKTPEEWDANAERLGMPDLVGKFDQRHMIAGQYLGIADAIEMAAPKDAKPQSAPGKLKADLDAGLITQEQFDAANKKNGITVTSPDGTVMQIGGEPDTGVGKAGQNDLDQKEIDTRDTLARLERIESNLTENPELLDAQSLTGKLKAYGLEWKDFITGGDLTDEQAQYLVDVTEMRGDVLENLNYTIKAITGAAMTESEAKRIGATLPNVNDSPTVFKAKLERALEATRMATARYNYWRNNGLKGKPEDVAPLSGMEDVIKKRADEIYKEELGNGEPADAGARTKARIAEEFGL